MRKYRKLLVVVSRHVCNIYMFARLLVLPESKIEGLAMYGLFSVPPTYDVQNGAPQVDRQAEFTF